MIVAADRHLALDLVEDELQLPCNALLRNLFIDYAMNTAK